jgi:hypothetical protein
MERHDKLAGADLQISFSDYNAYWKSKRSAAAKSDRWQTSYVKNRVELFWEINDF